ncbi:MAG TPA: chemotaxis protein CheW, partial [Methylomirabilota bacterium]|nr:chemotaxis protein CheW [Methylomirabilota bacterium]
MQRPIVLGNQVSFAAEGTQYLTFTLGGEEYGVEILKVQEIRGYSPITPLPNTPGYVKGMMNLRGTIIPVVDLRSRLSMRAAEPG